MATYTTISSTSGTPTAIFANAGNPCAGLMVYNAGAAGVAHIFVNGETGTTQEITLPAGVGTTIKRAGGINSANCLQYWWRS